MSLSPPSYVSATTGNPHGCMPGLPTCHCRIASRTTPTLCVFVIPIGPSRTPDSCNHVVPVISPLPFSVNHAPNTGSGLPLPRGLMTVTPVRIGPFPTRSFPLPEMSVVCPTSTPATSVMASSGPAVPPIGSPRSRARGFAFDCPSAVAETPSRHRATILIHERVTLGMRELLVRGLDCSADRPNQLIDLTLVDDERRRERDDVSS